MSRVGLGALQYELALAGAGRGRRQCPSRDPLGAGMSAGDCPPVQGVAGPGAKPGLPPPDRAVTVPRTRNSGRTNRSLARCSPCCSRKCLAASELLCSCCPAPPRCQPPPPPHCLRHQLPRDWPVWLPSCRPWVSSAAALGGGSASAYLPALLAVGAGPPGSALTRARVAGRQCDGEVARQGTPCAGGGFLVMAPAVPSTVQAVLRLSWGPDPPPHPCSTVAGAPLARTAPVRGSHAICVGLGLCTISWG